MHGTIASDSLHKFLVMFFLKVTSAGAHACKKADL